MNLRQGSLWDFETCWFYVALIICGHLSQESFGYNLKKPSSNLLDQRKGPLLAYIITISSAAFQGFKEVWCDEIQGLKQCHQDFVSITWLFFSFFLPVLPSVWIICCCDKWRGFKQHTFMISWCLWGTADLGLWHQAFPTKTEAKMSSTTEVSSEGLTVEGPAAKLMWFLKNLVPGGWLDWEPCCQPSAEAILATWVSFLRAPHNMAASSIKASKEESASKAEISETQSWKWHTICWWLEASHRSHPCSGRKGYDGCDPQEPGVTRSHLWICPPQLHSQETLSTWWQSWLTAPSLHLPKESNSRDNSYLFPQHPCVYMYLTSWDSWLETVEINSGKLQHRRTSWKIVW